ncbi:hypothetical protein SCANM63S_09016 [Streptomyces canarius]
MRRALFDLDGTLVDLRVLGCTRNDCTQARRSSARPVPPAGPAGGHADGGLPSCTATRAVAMTTCGNGCGDAASSRESRAAESRGHPASAVTAGWSSAPCRGCPGAVGCTGAMSGNPNTSSASLQSRSCSSACGVCSPRRSPSPLPRDYLVRRTTDHRRRVRGVHGRPGPSGSGSRSDYRRSATDRLRPARLLLDRAPRHLQHHGRPGRHRLRAPGLARRVAIRREDRKLPHALPSAGTAEGRATPRAGGSVSTACRCMLETSAFRTVMPDARPVLRRVRFLRRRPLFASWRRLLEAARSEHERAVAADEGHAWQATG